MEPEGRTQTSEGPFCYRIRIEGEPGAGLEDWLDVDSVRSEEGVTVLEVTAVDQAKLHALLRRLHDLHLRLIDLRRTEGPCSGSRP